MTLILSIISQKTIEIVSIKRPLDVKVTHVISRTLRPFYITLFIDVGIRFECSL